MTQQITAQLLKGGLTVDASGNITATKLVGNLQGNADTATTADSADTLNQQTSINLSGTYSTRKFLMADTYVLTDNVTVDNTLLLGKLNDDGNDIVIEGNYTFTTTGAGKVEAGYIFSGDSSNVDGMTGTLGSGITLGNGAVIDNDVNIPAASITGTLGSGVTFPTGHVIQTVSKRHPDIPNYSSTIAYHDALLQPCAYHSITAKGNNSSFLVTWNAEYGRSTSGRSQWAIGDTWTSGVSSYSPLIYFFYSHYGWYWSANGDIMTSYSYHDKSPGRTVGEEITYYIFLGVIGSGTDTANFQQLQIMEIAG